MTQKIIAGNWKMNLEINEGVELIRQITGFCEKQDLKGLDVIIAPPFIHLPEATKISSGKKMRIAAQNCSEHEAGAYTGEVSAQMLQSIEVGAVIIGHSERRQYHHEREAIINQKLQRVRDAGLQAILCVGEKIEERRQGKHKDVVKMQLAGALEGFPAEAMKNIIIAYEPVWAIGTGETATPEQAREMHGYIRNFLVEEYGKSVAEGVSLLYGGSVKPENAMEIFNQPDIDGGLIGGASLDFEQFTSLIKIGTEIL